jgi:hypothetical protein
MPGLLPEEPLAFPVFEEFRLANGLQVIHVQHAVQPIANLTLYLRTGGADDPVERAGRTAMAADLLDKGTTTRTAEQISEAIEGVGGSLRASADADFLTVSSTVLAEDLPLAFDLVADISRRPTFPEDEFALVRQRTLSGLRAQLGQPGEIARRRFVQEVYGAGHPYGTSPTAGERRGGDPAGAGRSPCPHLPPRRRRARRRRRGGRAAGTHPRRAALRRLAAGRRAARRASGACGAAVPPGSRWCTVRAPCRQRSASDTSASAPTSRTSSRSR